MSVHCGRCGAEIEDHNDGKLTTQLAPVVQTIKLCQDCWDTVEKVDIGDLVQNRRQVAEGGND